VDYTRRRGKSTVRLHVAKNRLSQRLGYAESGIRSEILQPLEDRGYLRTNYGPLGYQGDGCIRVREMRRDE
jgi:hypothetical protein